MAGEPASPKRWTSLRGWRKTASISLNRENTARQNAPQANEEGGACNPTFFVSFWCARCARSGPSTTPSPSMHGRSIRSPRCCSLRHRHCARWAQPSHARLPDVRAHQLRGMRLITALHLYRRADRGRQRHVRADAPDAARRIFDQREHLLIAPTETTPFCRWVYNAVCC